MNENKYDRDILLTVECLLEQSDVQDALRLVKDKLPEPIEIQKEFPQEEELSGKRPGFPVYYNALIRKRKSILSPNHIGKLVPQTLL